MKLNDCVACICEGAAEHAIMDLLLESNKLIFSIDQLLDAQIIRCRSARNFEKKHLRKGFNKKITVLRILDSRNESFKLSKLYINKVDIINIITAPEIEMLIIFNEDKYNDFKKSKLKPNEYCKIELKYSNVKNYEFVKKYFIDISQLINSIYRYKKTSNIRKGEFTLHDLIKK